MEKLRCKCVKGLDGFTWGEVYDVEFAGRVWWAVNDDGKRVSGTSESFDPIEEPISDNLEKEIEQYCQHHGYLDTVEGVGYTFNEQVGDIARYFVNWQKAKDESITKDLGECINKLSKQFPEVSFAKLSRIAVRVAKWKEQQLMANAVEGVVHHFEKCGVASVHYNDPTGVPMAYFTSPEGLSAGDKVKIIVIKED